MKKESSQPVDHKLPEIKRDAPPSIKYESEDRKPVADFKRATPEKSPADVKMTTPESAPAREFKKAPEDLKAEE